MKTRIPLQIIEGRLILTSVIECKSLRIPKQFMDFVIDTGSPDSRKRSFKLKSPEDAVGDMIN